MVAEVTTAATSRDPRREGRGGFSLLEVLIAMLILSVGAASVLALFAAAAGTHRRAVDRTRAAFVAERVFAEVQARYAPGSRPGELAAKLREEVPERFGDYAWEVYLHQPGAGGGGGSAGGEASPALLRSGEGTPGGLRASGPRSGGVRSGGLRSGGAGREGLRSGGLRAGTRASAGGGTETSSSGAEAARHAAWQESELLVRVLVRWKRSGADRSESFVTILLPRNVGGVEAPSDERRGGGLLRARR